MSDGVASIYLYGPLADKYGAKHEFAVSSPVEAVSALEANYPGFAHDFMKSEIYAIHADGDWRDGELAADMPFSREVHLVPQIEGRFFLGPLIIGALIPSLAGTLAATILGGILMTGLLIGVSMLFMRKKKQEVVEPDKSENYAFTGPENVTAQGVAVPLVYGRVYAGSVVISAGLSVNDESVGATTAAQAATAPPNTPPPPGGWPQIVGTGETRYPQGWMLHHTKTVGGTGGAILHKLTIRTYAPSPQPRPGIWYWYESLGNRFYTTTTSSSPT